PPGDSQVFQISIEPLSLTPGSLAASGIDSSWTRMELPKVNQNAASARVGDTLVIDLLVNPSTGQRIVDRISLRRSGLDGAIAEGRTPRDFALTDLQLDFLEPHVFVNG